MTRPSIARLAGGATVAGAVLAIIAGLSQAPYAHEAAAGSELRLAWRARSVHVDACRRRSAEELARLPVHMRQEQVCERRVAPYELEIRLDDSTIVDHAVLPAGARADRPLYVFEEVALAPGTYRVQVAFTRAGPADTALADDSRTAPARLTLDTAITLVAGRAALVTYDENARRLQLVGAH